MFFKYRPARLEDLDECQHFSRDHFAYTEQERQHLGQLWRELVTGGAGNFAVIEDSMAPVGQRIVWHCFAVFVPDDCVHSLTTAGLPLIGRQILTQWKRKESPLLSFAQVRQANSHGGVNMLILNSGAPSRVQTEEHWPSVSSKIVDFSIYHSSGYRLKQFLVELYSPWSEPFE